MNKYYYLLFKNHCKTKEYRYFNLILVICFLIILLSFMVYSFYTKGFSDAVNTNTDFRRFMIDNIDNEDEALKLKNVEHVTNVYNAKYMGTYSAFNVQQFSINGLSGTINLKPIINSDDIITTHNFDFGKNNNGYVVCPQKIYPNDRNAEETIDFLKILNGENYINQDLTMDGMTFKFVDTFDSDKYFSNKDECYISFDDYKTLVDKNDMVNLKSYNIQIDSVKNIKLVLSELDSLGYKYSPIYEIEYSMINNIQNITLKLILITVLISIIFIYLIIIKKIKHEKSFCYLLNSLGYSKKIILKINNIILIFNYLIAAIIGFIVFLLIYFILRYAFFSGMLLGSNGFHIPFEQFIIIFMILLFYILILNSVYIYKIMKRE